MPISTYSTSAGANTALFPEGMSPSVVNDSARQVQADIRSFYESIEWRDMGIAPTYLSATSFNVIGDQTYLFTVGRRMRLMGSTMTTVLATITTSVFGSGVTTVTYTVDSGTVNNSLNAVLLGIDPTGSPILALTPANNLSDLTNKPLALTNIGAVAKAGDNMTGALNFAKGTDIASAATVNLGAATGNYITITGTTTITAFDTVQAGTVRFVRFSNALTITHNAVSLILPTATNIVTVAGDVAIFVSEGAGNWRCVSYQRADGSSLFITPVKALVDGAPSTNGASNSNIILGTFNHDRGGAYNSTTGTFTCPRNGDYLFLLTAGVNAGSGTLTIRKNGATVKSSGIGSSYITTLTATLQCVAGDTLTAFSTAGYLASITSQSVREF